MSAIAPGALALAVLLAAAAAHAQECRVASGAQRAALIELYTSEGCSSCPPADRLLSRIGAAGAGTAVVALALHVDYWDYIGWKDPYARPEFALRQRMLLAANGRRTAYTPHFFVNGQEVRAGSGLERAIQAQSARAAGADVEVEARPAADGRLQVAARVTRARPARAEAARALYLAITESGLGNRIGAGENRGALLQHDHVVRHWFGPVAVRDGTASIARTLDWTSEQRSKGLQVAAFVQDVTSGEVLQAVATAPCKADSHSPAGG
jgi:hypothetical protein